MCNLCQVAAIPLDFLFNSLMLMVSYLILVFQMAFMFIFRFMEYAINKTFKTKTTP